MHKAFTSWLPRSLALGGLSVLAIPCLASGIADNDTHFSRPQAEVGAQQLYIIELDGAPALQKAGVNPNDLAGLKQQQQQLLEQLYIHFSQSEVQAKSQLLGNSVRVLLTAEQALKASSFAGVKRIRLAAVGLALPEPAALTVEQPFKADSKSQQAMTKAAVSAVGEGVKIALISSGVDYTHASLGGAGTAEAYQQAWQYAGVPFDGFPTAVVTKGWDFFSEREPQRIVADINPLDSALDSSNTTGGRGTALASIIHRLAPGAELWAGKIYRASRIGNSVVPLVPNTEQLRDALEWAIDPNRDGDTGDSADIIVLDLAGFGPGFYSEQDVWTDTFAAMAQNIQKAASLGALVLVPQGVGEHNSSYMTPIQAIAPAALAVGVAEETEATVAVSAISLHGPVRGDIDAIKPDLVGMYQQQRVALVGTGNGEGLVTDNVFALAETAASAAAIKSARPSLSGVELKALLVNTADNQVKAADSELPAAISWIGAGLQDTAAAIDSPAVAWELASGLPSLHLGTPEVQRGKTVDITRELYIRNLTDTALTYSITARSREGGPDAAALSWHLPAEVSIPARRAVTVPVTLSIDGSLLPAWPIKDATDYNLQQWRATEMDGYLTLTAGDDKPAISLPWLVKPRAAVDIQAHFDTYREQLSYLNIGGPGFPLGESLFNDNYFGREQEFENNSAHDVTFTVLPVVARNILPREATVGAKGGMILQNLVSAVTTDNRCDVGQKLTVGVTMFNPRALPFRSYFDTALNGSVDMFIVRNEVLTDYADMSVQDIFSLISDKDLVLEAFVSLDEAGVPVAYYHDLNIPINPANPSASLKASKLPVRFATDSRNLLADYCLEEILRDDLTLADLNKNLGYMLRTERDAMPASNRDPFIVFNPVNMGAIETRYEYDWFGNLIEVISNQANFVALSAKGGSTPLTGYSNELTLAPGERATLSAVMDDFCIYAGHCGKGFVLMADDADFSLWSAVTLGNDYSFVASPRQGQEFSVSENAESGQLVGVIQLESNAFFNIAGGEAAPGYELQLVTPLTDNALRITKKGEIFVDDVLALSADGVSTYHLKVFGQIDQSDIFISPTVEVLVKVVSVNVSAPKLKTPASAQLTGVAGTAISFNLAERFEDSDSDSLTFAATGLPEGLALSETGILSGRIQNAQGYQFDVTVSDGRHQAEFPFSLQLNAAPSTGSSGGTAGFTMLLALMLVLRRRCTQRI